MIRTVLTRRPVVSFLLFVALGCGGEESEGLPDAAPEPQVVCQSRDYGCECGSPAVFVDEVPSCTSQSVADVPNTSGLCCHDVVSCKCEERGCFDDPLIPGFCRCGLAYIYGDPSFTPVTTCPQPAGGHCCLDESLRSCTCGSSDCGALQEVSDCSIGDVLTCDFGDVTSVCL